LRLVHAVERAGAWGSQDSADLLRGPAFIECRTGEAAQIEWRDLDLEAGEIFIRGDAETGTKNWTVRRVLMIRVPKGINFDWPYLTSPKGRGSDR
jgi:integrase